MSRDGVMALLVGVSFIVMIGTSLVALKKAPPSPPEPAKAQPQPPVVPPPQPPQNPEPKPEPLPPKPEPKPEVAPPKPVEPMVERVPADGQDLADLLNVVIWKFRFHLPEARYTAHVWAEIWTRDSQTPRVEPLISASATWKESDIVLKLPTEIDSRLYLRLGEGNITKAPNADFLLLPQYVGTALLDKEGLKLDEPVHLVTMTHNLTELPRRMLKNAHPSHDATIYIKAGFTRGDSVPFEVEKWVPAAAPKPPAGIN